MRRMPRERGIAFCCRWRSVRSVFIHSVELGRWSRREERRWNIQFEEDYEAQNGGAVQHSYVQISAQPRVLQYRYSVALRSNVVVEMVRLRD